MCNLTPSAVNTRSELSEQTLNAIGEMVQAAVKHFDPDHTGPVDFAVCRPNPIEAGSDEEL